MKTIDWAPIIQSLSSQAKVESKDWQIIDEKKEVKNEEKTVPLSLVKGVFSGLRLPMFRTRLGYSGQLAINSAAGKYGLQFITGAGTSNTYLWSLVTNTAEWSSLDALFDQVFIHRVQITFKPRNKFSAQSTASTAASGSPGDINTIGGVIVCLFYNSAGYTDAAQMCSGMLSAQSRQIVDYGSPFKFKVKNPTRFDPKGDIGDQSSSTSTMGWCLMSSVSAKYGGFIQAATTLSSGSSAGIGALLEGGQFGDFFVEWDLSFRLRF